MNSSSFLRKQYWLASFMAVLALVLASCAPAAVQVPTIAPTDTSAPAPTAAPIATSAPIPVTGATAAANAVIKTTSDPKLGTILTDGRGMTLYAFMKDGPDKSNCVGGCVKAWPPFLTQGTPQAGAGVDQSMIGTATLADGTKIATYNHMPLYFWKGDLQPGDATGQGTGNVWFVVSSDGKPVKTGSSQPTSAPAASTPASASAVTINVVTNPKYGAILVDAQGLTLYAFKKDTADKSNCTAGCLKAWPPLQAQGNASVGTGLDASMVGTAMLADGTSVVTYNHMPLYHYAADTQPGDTNGYGISNLWYVVSPAGKFIDNMGAPTAATASNSGGGGYGGGGYYKP